MFFQSSVVFSAFNISLEVNGLKKKNNKKKTKKLETYSLCTYRERSCFHNLADCFRLWAVATWLETSLGSLLQQKTNTTEILFSLFLVSFKIFKPEIIIRWITFLPMLIFKTESTYSDSFLNVKSKIYLPWFPWGTIRRLGTNSCPWN